MNKFKNYVFNLLNKKNLTTNTKENYYIKLNIIKNVINPESTSLNFLKDTTNVQQYISTLNTSATIKSMYIAIYSTIKNSKKFKSEIKQFYQEQMEKYRDINNDQRLDNNITEIDQDNWLNINDIKNIPLVIEEIIIATLEKGNNIIETIWLTEADFKKLNKRLKQKYINLILDYVIIYLYTQREPLRLDYTLLRVEYNIEKNIANNKDYNLLAVNNNNKMILYLNNFKNVKKLGKQRQIFENNIVKVINNWFNILKWMDIKVEYLLYNVKGGLTFEPFKNNNAFGKKLTNIFEKYTGKRISIALLRRIYETSLIQSETYKNMTNRQKANKHKKLLHSANVAQEYNRIHREKIIPNDSEFESEIEVENDAIDNGTPLGPAGTICSML